MKIFVKAKPGAGISDVLEITDGAKGAERLFNKGNAAGAMRRFVVSVKEPAREGRANRAIERALADHFDVAPSRVRIVRGEMSREKVVEVGMG